MPHRPPVQSEPANVARTSICVCAWVVDGGTIVTQSLKFVFEEKEAGGWRGGNSVFRMELCTMAGPNCLRLLLCVWLCLSMSNITSHRGASARANTHTQTQCWTIEKAFMVLKTSVTWHLGQTLSNKAIAAHCLDPPPGTVCLSYSKCLSFLTSVSWHVTLEAQCIISAHPTRMHTDTLAKRAHTQSCTCTPKHKPTFVRMHATLQTFWHVNHSVFRASVFPNF